MRGDEQELGIDILFDLKRRLLSYLSGIKNKYKKLFSHIAKHLPSPSLSINQTNQQIGKHLTWRIERKNR